MVFMYIIEWCLDIFYVFLLWLTPKWSTDQNSFGSVELCVQMFCDSISVLKVWCRRFCVDVYCAEFGFNLDGTRTSVCLFIVYNLFSKIYGMLHNLLEQHKTIQNSILHKISKTQDEANISNELQNQTLSQHIESCYRW